ncbi:glycosyltransferase, partial [Rhodoblastus acidophilus]
KQGEALAKVYSAADVFVFPSKTDTYGLVLLEALASGVPVAAFPVTGPRDVIGDSPVGVLSEDLRAACLGALEISREACLEFAADHTWEA